VADRYGSDVLANDPHNDPHNSRKIRSVERCAEIGMVVEDPQSGFVGAVVRIERCRVELQDRRGHNRVFPLGPGFLVEGRHDAELVEQVWGDDLRVEGVVVKPARVGLEAWPTVPRAIEWKHGICAALGWPHRDQTDIAKAWARIRGSVRDWTDLEPELIGRVEELIDFVTQPV